MFNQIIQNLGHPDNLWKLSKTENFLLKTFNYWVKVFPTETETIKNSFQSKHVTLTFYEREVLREKVQPRSIDLLLWSSQQINDIDPGRKRFAFHFHSKQIKARWKYFFKRKIKLNLCNFRFNCTNYLKHSTENQINDESLNFVAKSFNLTLIAIWSLQPRLNLVFYWINSSRNNYCLPMKSS